MERNAKSLPRPYMVLLENIPQYNNVAAHQHVDAVFVAHPLPNSTLNGIDQVRWFTQDEVDALAVDTEIFADTKQTIHHVLTTYSTIKAQTLLKSEQTS